MRLSAFPLALALLCAACRQEAPRPTYLARVEEQTLTDNDLAALLEQAVAGQDTAALRSALIERWVAEALLYSAALRDDLLEDPEVAAQIEENRRAILTSAYVERYLNQNPPRFTAEEMQQYYDANRERLLLREPYVQYHLFAAPTEVAAWQARQALGRGGPDPDTLWQAFRNRPGFAVEVDSAGPERGLYATLPEVRDVLLTLRPGQTSGVVATDSLFYVVHVVARADAGQQAPLRWVQPEIVHRLTLERRKQTARRLVQQLRAEALARGALEVPTDSLQ